MAGVGRADGSRYRVKAEPRSATILSISLVNGPISGSRIATPTTLYAVWYAATSVTGAMSFEIRTSHGVVKGKSHPRAGRRTDVLADDQRDRLIQPDRSRVQG